jgi:hypothetical protein
MVIYIALDTDTPSPLTSTLCLLYGVDTVSLNSSMVIHIALNLASLITAPADFGAIRNNVFILFAQHNNINTK